MAALDLLKTARPAAILKESEEYTMDLVKTVLVVSAVMVVALTSVGCGDTSVCDRAETFYKACGGTFDRAVCDEAAKTCADSDHNGSIAGPSARQTCAPKLEGLSTTCTLGVQ
jgi:hypothetical protein